MKALLIVFIGIGIGIYLICRQNRRKKLDTSYEMENPIDTQNFTFEQAVDGCCATITKIFEMDEKVENTDKIMREKQNINGKLVNVLNWYLQKDVYSENKNCPESEKNRKYRIYYRTLIKIPVVFVLLELAPILLSSLGQIVTMWISILVFSLFFAWLKKIFVTRPSRAIRKERKKYPWRFNVQPLGSQIYILQQDFNDNLGEIHRLYYDLYLPCKRKADELIIDKKNREGEHYEAYLEIKKYETYVFNLTPMQRIRNFQSELTKRDMKRAFKITAIAAVGMLALTAGFISIASNASKDVGSTLKSNARYRDPETGNLFDEDGNRVPW